MLAISNRHQYYVPLSLFKHDFTKPLVDPPLVDANFLFNQDYQLGQALAHNLPVLPNGDGMTPEYATAYELAFRFLYPLAEPPDDLYDSIPSPRQLLAFEDHLIQETKSYIQDQNFSETEKHLKRQYDFSYKEIPYVIRLTIAATDSGLTPMDYKMMELMRLQGIEAKAMSPQTQDYATALNAIRTRIKLLDMEGGDEDAERVIEFAKSKNAKALPKPID